jgi:hypothetical protein
MTTFFMTMLYCIHSTGTTTYCPAPFLLLWQATNHNKNNNGAPCIGFATTYHHHSCGFARTPFAADFFRRHDVMQEFLQSLVQAGARASSDNVDGAADRVISPFVDGNGGRMVGDAQ